MNIKVKDLRYEVKKLTRGYRGLIDQTLKPASAMRTYNASTA